MVKKEPKYTLRESVVLRVSNGKSKFITKTYPQYKNNLEKAIVLEWISEQTNHGDVIEIVLQRESPDFIIKKNDITFNLELTRLTSKLEERNQAISLKYKKRLQNIFGANFHFEFLPQVYKKIPYPETEEGAMFLASIYEFIRTNKGRNNIFQFKINNELSAVFSFSSAHTISHPYILNEYWSEWYAELQKKWRTNNSSEFSDKCILLLYRTGSHIDEKKLRELINQLNDKFGNHFDEIWFIHPIAVGGISYKLFPN